MEKLNNVKNETNFKKNLKDDVNIQKLINQRSSSPNQLKKSQEINKNLLKSKNKSLKQRINLANRKNKSNASNPIPTNLKERMNYIKNLLKNAELIKYLDSSPPKNSSSFEEISKFMNNYSKNEVEVIGLIFLWMCNNILFDSTSFFSGVSPDCSAQNVFKTGLAISQGYANLFSDMCNSIGYKCEVVPGFAKGSSYKNGQNCSQNNHFWNAINIYENLYLVDTMWGAGYLNFIDKKFEKKLNLIYFLPIPELLILTHRPEHNNWQLTKKTMSLRQFEGKRKIQSFEFYYSVIEKNIDLITHPFVEINDIEKFIKIKIGAKNLILASKLLKNGEDASTFMKLESDASTGLHTFDLTFESNGNYELMISYKNSAEAEREKSQKFSPLLNYIINVNIIETKKTKVRTANNKIDEIKKSSSHSPGKQKSRVNDSMTSLLHLQISGEILFSAKNDTLISPTKPKCFDDTNAFIFEPKSHNIKIGIPIKFKVKVKEAINVAVLDYKQFHYLKKTGEDLWEGVLTLKTGLVSILSQKSSSLFTEIYEFTNFK